MRGLSQVAVTQGVRPYKHPKNYHSGRKYPFLAVSRFPNHLSRRHKLLCLLLITTFPRWEVTAESID